MYLRIFIIAHQYFFLLLGWIIVKHEVVYKTWFEIVSLHVQWFRLAEKLVFVICMTINSNTKAEYFGPINDERLIFCT